MLCRVPDRSKWLTGEGFNYPGVSSARQSNKHPLKPTSPRLEEITQVGGFKGKGLAYNISLGFLPNCEC